jgi:hypothetical protein
MTEDALIEFFTDYISSHDLVILLNNASKRQSFVWGSSERKNFIVTKEHIKKIFNAYYNGNLKAKHLKFIASIIQGSPRYGAEINEPNTFTYNTEVAEVVYHLSILNTMTPNIGEDKIRELNNSL